MHIRKQPSPNAKKKKKEKKRTPTITQNPAANQNKNKNNMKNPQRRKLVRMAPGNDAPVRPCSELVIIVNVVRQVEGLFSKYGLVCLRCVIDDDRVQDGAQNVHF